MFCEFEISYRLHVLNGFRMFEVGFTVSACFRRFRMLFCFTTSKHFVYVLFLLLSLACVAICGEFQAVGVDIRGIIGKPKKKKILEKRI